MRHEAAVWNAFHDFWVQKQSNLPILVVRYEDILLNRQSVLQAIRSFMHSGSVPAGVSRFRPQGHELGKRKGILQSVSQQPGRHQSERAQQKSNEEHEQNLILKYNNDQILQSEASKLDQLQPTKSTRQSDSSNFGYVPKKVISN